MPSFRIIMMKDPDPTSCVLLWNCERGVRTYSTPKMAHLFTLLLDEAVVHRLVVGLSVMRRQLRRLIEVANRPNISIEIVPFSAGLHPGIKGPFEIIDFADPSVSDIVYLEAPRGDTILARTRRRY